jgi:hypothetical protein
VYDPRVTEAYISDHRALFFNLRFGKHQNGEQCEYCNDNYENPRKKRKTNFQKFPIQIFKSILKAVKSKET